ncbi:TPA: VWA domain-containing protein [Vibrio vulnificus]|nr:VWA domain-containing protein [Vibrio vulnificus]
MSMKYQKGVAGVIFMGLMPVLVVTMVLSMQMTQRHLAHARVTEGAEVASLALIANPKVTDDENKAYAQRVVDYYVDDNKGTVKVDVYNRRCEYRDGCVQRSKELSPFTDFVVKAQTKHDSWIHYDKFGLEKEFEVTGSSTSRKFLPQPLDIYFIVDMSGSMRGPWGREGKTQYDVVVDTINRIVEDLKTFKTERKSRVAVIGFHHLAVKKVNGVRKALDYSYYKEPLDTVNAMFSPPQDAIGTGLERVTSFSDINLTDDYELFLSKLNNSDFYASPLGRTESWQGVIGAAQMANKAIDLNPEQVFILLSDGADNSFMRDFKEPSGWNRVEIKNYFKELVSRGLCEKLKRRISSKENVFQSRNRNDEASKTKVTMGVIGVNYKVKEADGIGDCFGRGNIYHAKQGNDVYKYILNLINEETGRLKD